MPDFKGQNDTAILNVLVIEYWSLRFICDLELVIWNLQNGLIIDLIWQVFRDVVTCEWLFGIR
jgi:hypothetical protein